MGFLPADDPLYLILVFIDEPRNGKYGGILAAPVFKEIAQRSMAYAGVLGGNGQVKKAPDAEGFPVRERQEDTRARFRFLGS